MIHMNGLGLLGMLLLAIIAATCLHILAHGQHRHDDRRNGDDI